MSTREAADPVLRRLSAVAAGHRRLILATALISAVTSAAGIGLIATAGHLISRSALVDSTAALTLSIVAVRFYAVVRAVGRYAERYVGHLTTFRILTAIRVWFFRGVEPGAPASLLDQRSGQLLTRIGRDVDSLQDYPLRVVVPRLAAGLAAAVGITVLGALAPAAALVLAVALLLVAVAVPLLCRRLGRVAARTVVAEQAELNGVAVEGLSGMADLLAYGREDLLLDRLAARTERRAAAERTLARVRGLSAALTGLLTGLTAVAVIWLAVPLVTSGRLAGVLLAVLPLAALATFDAVAPLAASYEHEDTARAAAHRLFEVVDRPVAVSEPATAPTGATVTGALSFHDVGFRYRDDSPEVLTDATFEIPAGAFAVVVGPSGAGKSTLPNLLLRFWEPQRGSIRLDGTDLRDLGSAVARRSVAVVAQQDRLFDTTLRDNLLLGDPDADDERIAEVCRSVALDEVVEGLPDGLSQRVGENGRRLSGGERQRVMIARALLAEAPILVLDEALVHLDPATAKRVLAGVLDQRAGRTTVLITHEPDAVDTADIILRIVDGHIAKPS